MDLYLGFNFDDVCFFLEKIEFLKSHSNLCKIKT